MNCPVCNLPGNAKFLYRKGVPIYQNLLLRSRAEARDIIRGDLLLYVCKNCGFVFNGQFEQSLLSYGPMYDNTQTCSGHFSKYVQDLVRYLVDECGIKGKRIVEIGCGKGSFLKLLCETGQNTGVGFDPSYVGPESDLDGRVEYKKQFYGPDCGNLPVDVVICRHVIEHVSDPAGLLKTIRQGLTNGEEIQIFFETPNLEWILKNEVFWDFFYEHCSYFSKESLITAFSMEGFHIKSMREVFRNQYLWIEAQRSSGQRSYDSRSPGQIPALAKRFTDKLELIMKHWQERLRELYSLGKIAVWGAGAKGVTFVNLLDPHCKWIDCVVDLNPEKQGGFVPGTGHPIVSYMDLPRRNVKTAILMNPNYREENQLLMEKSGVKVNLVDKEEA